MGGRRLVNWVTALAALALAALMAGPQAGASYVDDSPSFVPPFIDAMDGIAKRGDSWPADPSTWTHTAKIAPRGSPIGETEARIKLRIEGKGDPINQGMPQQTILTYADSSSMASKDPNDLRCSAQKSYVDLLKTPSEAGVSRFADSGVLGHNLSANYASVKGALTCSSSGASNMSEGLRVANDELIPRKKPGYVWVLILLTDAAWTGTNPQPQIDRAQNESVRIYTICLVGPCNNSELQLWSQQTGGKFYLVNQPNDLAQAYQDIANYLSSDIAGKPPKTGAPMLVFKLTDDIEVVPNAFMCDSSTCTSPTPSNPAFIVPGNRGIRMEWNAPVKELRIKQYWQIEFGVRSYTNGSNVKVNDVANSFVQYDRYDGSPGGSDVFEQLYVTVEPVVCNPGCLTRVEVSPPTASLLVGGQQQFAAQAFDQNGQPMSGVSFAWGVNGSIGQVTQSGMFTAQTVGSGDVWVDGTFNGTSRKSNARVTVSSPAPDTYPPRVVSTDPADQATAVPLSSKMSITWNESMDTASAVSAFSSTPAVACAWSWSGGTVQVCATATQFDPSTKYEVVISTAAKDVAGNALAAEMRFSFTTVAAPDTTPPVIVHTPPGAVVEGTDVGIKARVTDAGGVDAVDLHYRPAGASAFKRIPMPKISGSDFGGTILAIDVKPGKIQYYLEASDKSGNTANWPAGGASAPQMITVNPKDGGTQPPPPEPGGILGMGSTMDAVILGSIIAALIVALLAVMMMRKKKSAQAAPPPMGGQGKWGPPPTGADPWGQQGQGQQQWQPPPQGGQGGWR